MTYRVQVVLQGRSGIAEDQFVNTFHLDSTSTDIEAVASATTLAFSNIYNRGQGSDSIAWFLSNFIDRGFGAATLKYYDLNDLKPRVPTIRPWTLEPANAGTADLPEEVALCGSFSAAPPRTARRRGRVYFGPFNTTALGFDSDPSEFGPSRPSQLLRNAISDALRDFHGNIEAIPGYQWVILSPTGGFRTQVASGWCDDAWDTQRRRGVDPSTRSTWTRAGIQ